MLSLRRIIRTLTRCLDRIKFARCTQRPSTPIEENEVKQMESKSQGEEQTQHNYALGGGGS